MCCISKHYCQLIKVSCVFGACPSQVVEDTNMLTDGCLIDLCGVTLMWRTAIGLEQGPVSTSKCNIYCVQSCTQK